MNHDSPEKSDPPLVAASLKTAADIMTRDVITVPVGTSVRDAAVLMLEKRISALPVLAWDQQLVGMVSEGDLLGRNDADRLARRDWWLSLLKEGRPLDESFEALAARPVDEVMRAPVMRIEMGAALQEIAEALQLHDIKRLPVMRGDRLVGIVSRSDLVRALAAEAPKPESEGSLGGLMSLFSGMMRTDVRPEDAPEGVTTVAAPPPTAEPPATAAGFRELVTVAEQTVRNDAVAAKEMAELERLRQIKLMLNKHLDERVWAKLIDRAKDAAAHGENSFELIRFPCDLCSDGGRKIDVAEADWPTTLRGEAAEVYERWRIELRPAGFRLSAQIAEYLDGIPSQVALSLAWAAPGSEEMKKAS